MLRPIHRDWYFINFYITIDAIKYRVMQLTTRVKDAYKPSEEKKDYFCPRCRSEWTQMEVLSNISQLTGEFACQKCNFTLERHETTEADRAGHEHLSRLMSQLDPLIRMLRRIDEQQIPENDFETAEALRVPIQRDEAINPSRKMEPVRAAAGGALRGAFKTETGPAVEVSLVDPEAAERERREQARRQEAQNVLPEWHTTSTVTGEMTALGLKEQARQSVAGGALRPDADEAKDKKAVADADGVDQSMMDAYLAQLREEQALKAAQPDSDYEDDDDDEFENVGIAAAGSGAATPTSSVNGATNGLRPSPGRPDRSAHPASSPLKRASPDSDSATPGTSAANTPRDDGARSPSKRAKIEHGSAAGPAAAPAPANGADSDEDDEEFEDAL